MKLLRVDIPWRTRPSILHSLLESNEINFLQLDFGLPVKWLCSEDSDPGQLKLPTVEFLNPMKLVHKWLFLRPDFAVLTNAGASQVMDCMETLAQFLVEHGSDEMLISAVRGTNLLATVDPWLPTGIANSGRKVLAAQVEIGGGPLATAIVEGARIVVTGAYDQAAPLLAAAVAGGEVGWQDFDTLAALALASNQVGSAIELSPDGVEVVPKFEALQKSRFADVFADGSRLAFNDTTRGTSQIAGVVGSASDSLWNLRVTLDAGFSAVVLIAENASPVCEFCEESYEEETITVDEYVGVNGTGLPLSRVTLAGNSYAQCRQRLELLESWAGMTDRVLAEPAASIYRLTESAVIRIPADQVTLAVDTRPAREWL